MPLFLDPNNVAQDYKSWTGLIYPAADPITLYLSTPNSGIAGTWNIYVVVLNSTGQFQDSKINLITVGVPADTTSPTTTLTIGSPQYIDIGGNVYVNSSTLFTLTATDNPGGTGVKATAYRIYDTSYDTGWLEYTLPFNLLIPSDGAYNIDYNSTDNAGNVELTRNQTVFLDNTAPTITDTNFEDVALQDGVTLGVSAWDLSEVASVSFSIKCAQGDIVASGSASLSPDGKWEWYFDTIVCPDGYYSAIITTTDVLGNTGDTPIQFSIRNWACIELLPACESNKAGRTMPVKFSLRIEESVDPAQPFVRNEELTIKIYEEDDDQNVLLQISTYGITARDYRIDSEDELYITNFRTIRKKPKTYLVEIYRKDMLLDSFEFSTVK